MARHGIIGGKFVVAVDAVLMTFKTPPSRLSAFKSQENNLQHNRAYPANNTEPCANLKEYGVTNFHALRRI